MCGIAGLFDRAGLDDRRADRLETALSAMIHRGPDGEGRFLEPQRRLAMGMRRLAIQDPAGGRQPVFTEDGAVAAVFNGEIYNYVELREELEARGHVLASRSDSEVLVHLYEELGPAFVARLNGMFAIALWDARAERLLLARDPLGIKPLFVRLEEDGRRVFFGSELTALLPLLDRRPRIDPTGVKQTLTFGYPVCPRTILDGVSSLRPGEVVTIAASGGVARTIVAPPAPAGEPVRDERRAMDLVEGAFEASLRRQLRSDVPLGLFLSGGLDSGLVAAYAHRVDPAPRPAFFLGFAEKSYDEEPLARATAAACGFEFIRAELRPEEVDWTGALRLYDAPNMDFSIINSFTIARVARDHGIKTVLGGDGGDEIFGGYQTYQANLWARLLAPVPRAAWSAVLGGLSRAGASYRRMSWDFFLRSFAGGMTAGDPVERHLAWRRLYRDDEIAAILPEIAAADPTDAAVRAAAEVADAAAVSGNVQPYLRVDQRTYLEGDTLTKTDRGTMAASLEARVPLLDLELVAAARSLDDRFLATRRETKVILRRLADRRLPAAVARAPKGGFTAPVQVWLKEGRIGPANEAFTPGVLREVGIAPDQALAWWYDHRAGRANHGRRLWVLLGLVDWARRHGYALDRLHD